MKEKRKKKKRKRKGSTKLGSSMNGLSEDKAEPRSLAETEELRIVKLEQLKMTLGSEVKQKRKDLTGQTDKAVGGLCSKPSV